MNITRSHVGGALGAALLVLTAVGCSPSVEADKPVTPKSSPYAGDALTLTLGTDDSPGVPSADQITHFAAEAARLSDGKITIEPQWHAQGDGHPLDWDQAVAAMVQDGELDMALGPTWAWDVLDVTSLQPLQTPFLVDSDSLVEAIVQDEDLVTRLMSGLEEAGVTGLALWPEGLRHPFGFDRPLTRPEHYAGQTIRSARSRAISQLFDALGAETSPREPNAETMAGAQGEFALMPNGIATGNVTFFPKVNLLYVNAATYASLDGEAIEVLTEAASTTQAWAIEQTSDVAAGEAFCADGGTVVAARADDLVRLVKATEPTVDAIAKAPGNESTIEAITRLKEAVPTDETASTCTGEEVRRHKPGPAEAALNGTYRYVMQPKDFREAGRSESQIYHNAGVLTYTLEDGKVRFRLDPSEHEFNKDPAGPDETDGTYQVDGKVLTFWFPAYNEVDRMMFETSGDGDLSMTPLDFPDADVEHLMTSKVWEKIT